MDKKIDVTIKKVSSNEPNVSKRHTSYDIYHNGKYHTTFNDINDAMDHKEKMHKEDMDLDETVLSIQQRQKRAQIMRRNKSKIQRAREISKKKMAPEANIRKRAFVQARQLIRRRVAGSRGAEYEKLGPSEKIAIDRAVEGKQKAIKKLALRLIPRVKQAEAKRLHTFMKGQQIQNHGQPEGKSKESSGSSSVKESLNVLFNEAFPPGDASNAMGQRVDNPVTSSTKKMPPKGKSKNDVIIQYNKFNEEVENDSPAFTSLFKKSEKSGIDLEVLGEVYNRGWNTWTEDCKVSQQQYAFARVNSFINQGKTYFDEDADLHERHAHEPGEDAEAKTGRKMAVGHLMGALNDREKHGNKKVDQAFGFNEAVNEARAPGRAYVAPFHDDQGNQRGWKSSNKWGKVKYWQPFAKKSAMKHAGLQEEETQINEISPHTAVSYLRKAMTSLNKAGQQQRKYKNKGDTDQQNKFKAIVDKRSKGMSLAHAKQYPEQDGNGMKGEYRAKVRTNSGLSEQEAQQTNENFIDGKGPGKPGDSARHGLKGKSTSELKRIRSSDSASPRKKQLAHFMLNMTRKEEAELDEKRGLWDNIHAKRKRMKAGSSERMRKPGSEGAPTKQNFRDASEEVAIPDNTTKKLEKITKQLHKSVVAHGKQRDLITNLIKKDKKDITEEDTENGTQLVDKESNNSKVRKKIEVVDRKPPFTGLTRQTEIQKKIIDEDHTKCSTPECCGQCDTAVVEKLGNTQNDSKKRLAGTDSLVKAYKADTPYASKNINESFNIAFAAGVGVTLTAADLGMHAKSSFALHPSVIEQMNEMEEEARSADVKGVVVHTTNPDGTPGKTIVRKQKVNHKIIGTGNLTDGKPDDTV